MGQMSQKWSQSAILSDGRKLGYAEYGSPGGRPIFYFHGYPSSRYEAALTDRVAQDLNLRIIAADRPGYGLSDHQSKRSLADWSGDVVELADRLGIEHFAVLGVSGGGPYASCCAWKIPERLRAVGIVCGLGPVDNADSTRGMHSVARLSLGLASKYPCVGEWLFKNLAGPVLKSRPQTILRLLSISCARADQVVLRRNEVKCTILSSFREAFRQSAAGPAHDLVLLASPWGFRMEDIDVPIHLWHGTEDRTVPVLFSHRQAETLPYCSSRFISGEGHFSLPVNHMQEILETLAK